MADDEYKITEKDVLSMLKYLRYHLPEYATPQNAIFLLKNQQEYFKHLEKIDPLAIEEVLKNLEKN